MNRQVHTRGSHLWPLEKKKRPCFYCPVQMSTSGFLSRLDLTPLVAVVTRSWELCHHGDSITFTSWFLIWTCHSQRAFRRRGGGLFFFFSSQTVYFHPPLDLFFHIYTLREKHEHTFTKRLNPSGAAIKYETRQQIGIGLSVGLSTSKQENGFW